MKVIYDKKGWDERAVMATIGFFDGVHPGHRFLLQEMQTLAKERHIPSAVITFPVHPRVVLQSDYQPKLLNSFDEKLNLLAKTGVDYIIVMDFTPELARLTAREFIENVLILEWKVQTLLVGYNHRFGFQHAEGDEQFVLEGMVEHIEVIRSASFSYENGIAISSSIIRRLIETGDVKAASRMLGYDYRLKGHVVTGNKIGRILGFPTANLEMDEKFKVMPRFGSYAVRVLIDGKKYNGMLYIGSRPTIGVNNSLHIEVNIFDFSDDIYNMPVIIEFIEFIREDRKFDSLDELRKQLGEDKEKAELVNSE